MTLFGIFEDPGVKIRIIIGDKVEAFEAKILEVEIFEIKKFYHKLHHF